MKKKILLIVVVSSACLILVTSAHSQEDMQFVNADAFSKPRRPAAVFRHDAHNESAGIEACQSCHHVYDDSGKPVEDESSEDQRCSECHGVKRSGSKPALMNAFHANCKSCHKEKKKGPVICGHCHVRRVKAGE